MSVKVGILYTGGKDSNYAMYIAVMQGFDVKCLISILPKSRESYMFHYPNIHLTHLQARAIDLPLVSVKTEGIKEEELRDLKKALKIAKRRYNIDGIFTGAIISRYQKQRVEGVCGEIGLKCFTPLWHKDPETYLRRIIDLGFEVLITSVSALGLDESWLGRKIDEECLNQLKELNEKYGLHIAFEGGEAETFVTDCPLFKKKVKIIEARKRWEKDSGILEITEAILVSK